MNGALGWRLDHRVFPDQFIADLGGTPAGIFALELQDCALDLEGQLIGMAIRATATILQAIEATILVSAEDFVTCGSGDTELAAQSCKLCLRYYNNRLEPGCEGLRQPVKWAGVELFDQSE